MNIQRLFECKKVVYSLEVFPPKKTTSIDTIYNTLYGLRGLRPDFISVTYGAGGSEAQKNKTCEIASLIKSEYQIEPVSHLTCVGSTKQDIMEFPKILINECNGIFRKRKNVIPYEEYMDNMRLTEEDRYSHLYMAIMELPEDLRILVTLYYLEGFSQKEISEALDIPEGTIKSRLSRARDFLKAQLSDEEEKRPMPRKNSKLSKRITGKGKMSC